MTALAPIVSGLFLVYGIYIASLSARSCEQPQDFLDAGGSLPAWTFVFAVPGIVMAGLILRDHLLATALYGLQVSHVAIGVVVVAMCGIVVQKRLALASEMCGIRSPIELVGAYYGSPTLRLYLLVILFLFAVPFAGYCAYVMGDVVSIASNDAFSRTEVVWTILFFLFLGPVIGGWRGTIYIVAAQSTLVLALLVFSGLFPISAMDGFSAFTAGVGAPKGILSDKIPGVIQYVGGIGKDVAVGGFMTTTAILTSSLSLIGIVLSPAFCLLATTTRTRTGFAFGQVWMMAGLAAGTLLLVGPVLAGIIAHANGANLSADSVSITPFVAAFSSKDVLAAVCILMLLATSLQTGIVFFISAAANIFALDVVARFALPLLSAEGRRLTARIVLAILFTTTAIVASFAGPATAILSPLALSLSAQLLPAFLGLCWVPWISRSAVITGLIFGVLLVVFTEPPGLILMDRLSVALPWGRWPLTIHSAGWGLAFNIAACLLVSIFTRNDSERESRQRLHDVFTLEHREAFGGRAARGAKWSLPLIWAFLAIGPGAILGNDFFAHPVFTEGDAKLGVPSLWIWQVVFWLIGVLLVWWLAYHGRMSVFWSEAHRKVRLDRHVDPFVSGRAPQWLALLLARLAER